MLRRRFLACLMIVTFSRQGLGADIALGDKASRPADQRIARPDGMRQPAAEYYTTDPQVGVLMRVNIWGDVTRPGVHFVREGATLIEALSSAGGPLGSAEMPKVRLIRDTKEVSVDVFSPRGTQPLRDNDMIFIDRSFKNDLPLIYGTVSTLLSIVTLYIVLKNQKD